MTVCLAPTQLVAQYQRVRSQTEALCQPLAIEDYGLQAMADASPPKWHLGHTTWFFETFLLLPFLPGYRVHHPGYDYLFNSYYEAVGDRHPRHQRGLISRPTVAEVYTYRAAVDAAMAVLLEQQGDDPEILSRTELGLHHEQQHQELLLMDILYNLSVNPLQPAYRPDLSGAIAAVPSALAEPSWIDHPGGLVDSGAEAEGFHFDNEGPLHQVYLPPFRIADRLVTNGEYLEFIEEGGYGQAQWWLSEGWTTVNREGWQAPLYWQQRDGVWCQFTLAGLMPLERSAPVCHVSHFEADAYARWRGGRLPMEGEWETVARTQPRTGNLLEGDRLRPIPGSGQWYGDAWEWTASPYIAYPGYRPAAGALGEYNGKFMCNQMVLRGGACVTPADHIRPSYRNFFPSHSRWMFSGIRLGANL